MSKNKKQKIDINELDKTNKILIDWVSFSTSKYTLDSLINLLGLSDITFTDLFGCHGYTQRKYFDGINIHYAPTNITSSGKNQTIQRDDNSVWVEMSGQGCRNFETFSGMSCFDLLKIFKNNKDDFCVNRLDIAYDDFEKNIDLCSLESDIKNRNVISRFNRFPIETDVDFCNPIGTNGVTVNMGSCKSDVMFRVYDKAIERGYADEVASIGFSWVRWEIQLRHNRCDAFINKYFENENIGDVFKGIILNYFRPVVPDENDSNKSRWKSPKWFNKFIGSVSKISLFTPCTTEYNLEKCERFVFHQAGNAAFALLQIYGRDKFFEMLDSERSQKIPQKYEILMNKHKTYGSLVAEHEKMEKLHTLVNYSFMLKIFIERYKSLVSECEKDYKKIYGENADTSKMPLYCSSGEMFCTASMRHALEKFSSEAYINVNSDISLILRTLDSKTHSSYVDLIESYSNTYVDCDKDSIFNTMIRTFSKDIFFSDNLFCDVDTGLITEETGKIMQIINDDFLSSNGIYQYVIGEDCCFE